MLQLLVAFITYTLGSPFLGIPPGWLYTCLKKGFLETLLGWQPNPYTSIPYPSALRVTLATYGAMSWRHTGAAEDWSSSEDMTPRVCETKIVCRCSKCNSSTCAIKKKGWNLFRKASTVIFSADDWDVQSPPKGIVFGFQYSTFSEGDWIPQRFQGWWK